MAYKIISIIILVIHSLSASAEGKISLKCELDERGLMKYEDSKYYKKQYSRLLKNADMSEESARYAALLMRKLGLELELKNIEIDMYINNVSSFKGVPTGDKYEWDSKNLSYTQHWPEETYLAVISREDLSYLSFVFDRVQETNEYFSGKCEVIKFKREF